MHAEVSLLGDSVGVWDLGGLKAHVWGGGGWFRIPVMYKVKVSAPQDVGW